jgi:multidrug resistance efflux pump
MAPSTVPPTGNPQLPSIDERAQPAGRFVNRAVTWSLLLLAGLAATALVVGALLRVDVTVDAPGFIEPQHLARVRARSAGLVGEVLVRTGQSVRAGQSLVQLDSLSPLSTVRQLEAQFEARALDSRYAAATVEFEERTRGDVERKSAARALAARATMRQRLLEYGIPTNVDSVLAHFQPGTHVGLDVATSEVVQAESDLRLVRAQAEKHALERIRDASAAAELEALAAQLAEARQRLAQLRVVSPVDGTVVTESLDHLVGASVREGDVLMEVASTKGWRVTIPMFERDVHRVRIGDRVNVRVRAFGADELDLLRGRVVHIAHEPTRPLNGTPAAAELGQFRVIAELDVTGSARLASSQLRSGYSVEAHVITRSGRLLTLLWRHLWNQLDERGR